MLCNVILLTHLLQRHILLSVILYPATTWGNAHLPSPFFSSVVTLTSNNNRIHMKVSAWLIILQNLNKVCFWHYPSHVSYSSTEVFISIEPYINIAASLTACTADKWSPHFIKYCITWNKFCSYRFSSSSWN